MYLTVLSVARVMIAQWENECISLPVLSIARVMIGQWENECISLSVLSWPWYYYRPGRLSPADHTLPTHPKPVWQKIAQSPINGPT